MDGEAPHGFVDGGAVLRGLFRSLLGREPSTTELDPLLQHLSSGGAVDDVVRLILQSDECSQSFFRNPTFRDICAPEGLPPELGRLYLWHIPKTAGTSLRQMLRTLFPPDQYCGDITRSEFLRLSPARLRKYRLIAGHFGPTPLRLLADVHLITLTVVREPVATILSAYGQWRRHGPAGHPWTELSQTLSFDDWCHNQEVRTLWSNAQARSLCLEPRAPAWPGHGESGEGETSPVSDRELGKLATTTLAGIDVVGTPDDLLDIYRACARRLSLPSPIREPSRENVATESVAEISVPTRRWLSGNNEIDQAMFELALSRRLELRD